MVPAEAAAIFVVAEWLQSACRVLAECLQSACRVLAECLQDNCRVLHRALASSYGRDTANDRSKSPEKTTVTLEQIRS